MRLFVQRCLIPFALFLFLPAYAQAIGYSWEHYQNITTWRAESCGSYNTKDEARQQAENMMNNDYAYCYNSSFGYECEVRVTDSQGCNSPGYSQIWIRKVRACEAPLVLNPETNTCEEPPVEPEDCFEMGQVYDPNSKQCTLSCPNGQLNGQCLENPESECDHHSTDFIGYVGSGRSAVCGDQVTECNAAGGQFGIFNGSAVCVSEDYGPPPICGPNEVSVYDTYGFTCGPILGGDGNPQWEDGEPNEDTDGDGVPDRFNPNLVNSSEMIQIVGGNIFNQNNHIINQNNITNHNLTNINNSVNNLNQTINQQGEQANQNLEGIAGILGQIAGDVSNIATNGIPGTGGGSGGDGGDGTGDGTGEGEGVELGTIEGLLGDANDKHDSTNEKLDKIIDGEEGGLSTEGLGDAPGFGDSVGRLQTAFFDHPTIQKVTTLPSLAEGSSCPVFTIPANDYWDSLTMDMHCTVLEDYRGMLSGMFLFFWTVLAIFAFLRA